MDEPGDQRRPPATGPPTVDYDLWSSTEVVQHVENLFDRLRQEAQSSPDIRKPRWPWVDPKRGDAVGARLCWVCYEKPTYTGRMLPRFRACFACLCHDRSMAGQLDLKMLLPLMDYPSQPILPGWDPPSDPTSRGWLADVWSQVSLLQRWRIEGIRVSFAVMGVDTSESISVWDWSQRIGGGRARSRACWNAFVSARHPRIRDVLDRIEDIQAEHGAKGTH